MACDNSSLTYSLRPANPGRSNLPARIPLAAIESTPAPTGALEHWFGTPQGAYVLVKYGTLNGQSSYIQYNGYTGEAIVGATGLTFVEFTNFGYVMGNGLNITSSALLLK